MSDIRLFRTEMLLGHEGIKKLKKSTVMIIGLGAVGGYALEAIARAGIGHLIVVDFDVFDESNINRQILALSSTIGRKKIDVAKERVLEINPSCHVETIDMFVNSETISELLSRKVDYVIDAIDALNPKCCLMEELYNRGLPFVSSMGAALKSDPSFIRCAPLSGSKNCGLAKFIRKRLRKRGVEISSVMSVFSDEQVALPETAIQMLETNMQEGRNRNTMGSLPTITAIFGLTLANYVIKQLSGFGKKEKENANNT